MRNLLKNRPHLTRGKLEWTRQLMDRALPDATVKGYEPLIESLELPDKDDRHVLAAAIHCGADLIVIVNSGDIPRGAIAGYDIEAQHPDDFVLSLLETFSDVVLEAARNHCRIWKNPPRTQEEFLAEMRAQGLRKSVSAIRELVAGGPAFI